MKDGPSIAAIAALIGDPARANMLTALMDGRALTVSELAEAAGVGLPTASGHLGKLDQAGLVTARTQGRHRYFALSGPDIAELIETLMGVAERTGARRVRTGPRDAALRTARVCYDHLAGERAVALLQGFVARGLISEGDTPMVTAEGRAWASMSQRWAFRGGPCVAPVSTGASARAISAARSAQPSSITLLPAAGQSAVAAG
ncbi:helix-turn-helix transcriptional regulator [Sphingomonas sp. RT2P30]|uniref:ArsR/SmtB family transcription factor n=1 Tax=Parasphingomonas halimpatiens TaxID=3096162 RepID=UPI002FC821E3